MQDLNELVTVFTITQTCLQLIQTDGSVAITIQCLEDTLELLDIVRVRLHRNCHQGHLLDLFRLLELFEVANVQTIDRGSRLLPALVSVRCQPSMLKSFISSKASLRPRDQFVDKILSLSSNLVPLLSIVVEVAPSDHLKDLLIVIAVEGRVAAEQNVEHAASGPHIAAHIVVAREYLR